MKITLDLGGALLIIGASGMAAYAIYLGARGAYAEAAYYMAFAALLRPS